jgi:hypothetical protein
MDALRSPLSKSSLASRVFLVGGMGLALLFRLPGIQWGLPLKYAHIDESVVIHYSLRIVAGAINPGFYDYPGFFLYLLAGTIRLMALVHGWIFGTGLDQLMVAYGAGDPTFFTLTARGLTVAFALLTVGLLYSMGSRFSRWSVGLGAALLLGVNALHIRSSHYGILDVAACCMTLWAMDKIVTYGVTHRVQEGAVAAFVIGLATATKYYPGILLGPLLILPFVGSFPKPHQMFGVILLMFAAGLFVGSPYTVLSAGEFFSRFNHLAPKIVGLPNHSVLFLPTLIHLWHNAGPMTLVAGAVGLGYAFWEKGPWRLLAVLWSTLFIFLGCWVLQTPHYGLALYPPLFLFAFHAADQIPWRRPLPVLVLAGILVSSALPSAVQEVRYFQRQDTRLQAADWVRAHISPGSKILRFSHTPDFKRSDPFQIKVDFTDQRLSWMGQGPEEEKQGIQSFREFDYLIVSGGQESTSLFDRSFSLVKRFSDPVPSGYHNPVVSIYATRPPLGPPKAP